MPLPPGQKNEPAAFAEALRRLKGLTWYRGLRHLRKRRDRGRPAPVVPECQLQGQAASDLVRSLLEAPEPCMVARFGNNELRTIENHLATLSPGGLAHRVRSYLDGEIGPWWWDDRTAREMRLGAGFFPATPGNLERFALLSLEDSTQIDVLGAWLPAERLLLGRMRATRVPLQDLEPYFHEHPWSEALRGRRVLVIHPFAASIQRQYEQRTRLFKDPRVLPDFQLQVFPAVQSIGGEGGRFPDWFAALAWMEGEIARLTFDVAIIGAGAYGMPLAAFIKRDLGRKAVHLGGATQILFGIRGRRWDAYPAYSGRLYNDAWIRPASEETPPAAGRVEGGCYW